MALPEFLRAALAYALRLDWPVFPLHGKKPLTPHGFKDASTDETQIRKWWKKHPKANIGVPTGQKFWAFDVDPRHGGDESLEHLIYVHGALTGSVQQMTGGGGKQYLFAMPDQQAIGCRIGLWQGIDIKGSGGYILVPPSIHPLTGKPYIWDGAEPITKQILRPAPPWLLMEIETARNGKAHERVRVPEQIPKGMQHVTLFRLGCAMRANGFGEAEIFAALWEANRTRCEEPGPEQNIRKLSVSICSQYDAGSRTGTQSNAGGQPSDADVPPEYRMQPDSEQANGGSKEPPPFGEFDIGQWFAAHDLQVRGPLPYATGKQMWQLVCPFCGHPKASILELNNGARVHQCDACGNCGWREFQQRVEGRSSGAKASPGEWDDPIPLRERAVPAIRSDLFPGALGDMARAAAKATETPEELAGLLGTAVASSCVAKKAVIEIEPGYSEPLNVYVAVAMESGNRKTSVFLLMTRPLVDWEHREAKRLEPEIKRAKSERKSMEARIDQLRAMAAKPKQELNTSLINQIAEIEASLPDVPQPPRLWTQDVTPEKLAVLMQQQRERMAVFSDEGGIFDILAGRYSGVPNLDIVLQGHSGSPVRVDRATRETVMLQNPILTFGISPQPDVLAHLSDTPGFRGRGLLARYLYDLPISPLGSRLLSPAPCPVETVKAYRELIERLLELSPPEDEGGVWQPWRLELSEGAYRIWKEFQRAIETLMREGGKLEYLRDWASKLPGAAARIAGVFHCVTSSLTKTVIVEAETMRRAVDLATPLIDHALAAFDLMGCDERVAGALKILAWVRREGLKTFTVRDCFHAHQRRFKQVRAMQPSLELLVEHGYLRRLPKPEVAHRPSEPFEVNPRAGEASG
jgi:hypothetical protein